MYILVPLQFPLWWVRVLKPLGVSDLAIECTAIEEPNKIQSIDTQISAIAYSLLILSET